MIFTNLIQTNLTTQKFGHEIEYFTFTNSTNEDVWDSFSEGIEEGFLVITDHQKKGRGRRGNRWLSEPGSSLTCSFLIKPQLALEKIGILPLLMGVSVVEAISKISQLDCKLKWPNDIILNDKKVGGILAESKRINGEIYVVMGLGINVNEQELPSEISSIATTLRIEKKSPIQREPLLAFILNAFEANYNKKDSKWINRWNSHCAHINSKVKFHHVNKVIEGIFLEIDEIGQAILKINNITQKFTSGVLEL